MDYKDCRSSRTVSFDSLSIGDVFCKGTVFYMKTNNIVLSLSLDNSKGMIKNAVILIGPSTGTFRLFGSSEQVEPVEAKLIVENIEVV